MHLGETEVPSVRAVQMIAAERQRQVDEEGRTPEHDDRHVKGDLANAAACYAATDRLYVIQEPLSFESELSGMGRNVSPPAHRLALEDPWPWMGTSDRRMDRPWSPRATQEAVDDRIRELVKAGALVTAEIERLMRLKKVTGG